MGKSREEAPSGNFSFKKESDLSPVDPCQGWVNPCEFCDRRFGQWIDADEENLAKVPTKPGIFQMAFKSKNTTEIVSITLDTDDVQKVAYETVDKAKELIADKKSKVTKTVILCRWMVFKKGNDKDIAVLYAHWHNYDVLPKLLKSWPGLDSLQKTDSLTFSDRLQKWCYPKKDTFWKKPKQQPAKLVEVVKQCKWTEPCEICDAYFTKWERLDDVIARHKSPDSTGIYELAVFYGEKVDRAEIDYCLEKPYTIKKELERYRYWKDYLRKKEYANKNAFLQVRWIELRSPESDNSCFLYAHLFNGDPEPKEYSQKGEEILEKNKRFICRIQDSKWCYVLEDFKNHKETKFKKKKNILNAVEEDILYLNFIDN
ncbi:uncharacterized protein LOC129972298 [Argiope bruennichi]|uniref:Uncharacterized protein n=1 Tax=Argiope bruennichi TaxID=94029 RepID=A0A8T0FB28_ARGBR|nr:uncharacterized protein LOC129972298 [Argiope bruennichi]KAF8787562.1 hypothetical protein HNY73_009144 [Argiope bruennichi]